MNFPKQVKLVEVGPRDGLQNQPQTVPTSVKVELIDRLSMTGLQFIEVTSFVSPKWVPQMADHLEVLQKIHKQPKVNYLVLVPNERGLQDAITAGAKSIAVFAAASETFSKKNINCTIDESLERYEIVINKAKKQHSYVRAYISCALGCPYEGEIHPTAVARVANQLYELGCDEISLGDTIGVGTANQTKTMITTVAENIPINLLAVHFHDTFGQALANIYAALELGISIIDSSVAGLGGCPYAPGAAGNVASEDVLYMLNGLEIETGVDLSKMIAVGQYICQAIGAKNQSKVAQAAIQHNR